MKQLASYQLPRRYISKERERERQTITHHSSSSSQQQQQSVIIITQQQLAISYTKDVQMYRYHRCIDSNNHHGSFCVKVVLGY